MSTGWPPLAALGMPGPAATMLNDHQPQSGPGTCEPALVHTTMDSLASLNLPVPGGEGLGLISQLLLGSRLPTCNE